MIVELVAAEALNKATVLVDQGTGEVKEPIDDFAAAAPRAFGRTEPPPLYSVLKGVDVPGLRGQQAPLAVISPSPSFQALRWPSMAFHHLP